MRIKDKPYKEIIWWVQEQRISFNRFLRLMFIEYGFAPLIIVGVVGGLLLGASIIWLLAK